MTAPEPCRPIDSVFRIGSGADEVEVYCDGIRPASRAWRSTRTARSTSCEGLVGDSGVYRIGADRTPERIVASPPPVGIAFDGDGGLVLATGAALLYVETGIVGRPPTG